MKRMSFHISTLESFWDNNSTKKYIAEPYVADHYGVTTNENVVIASHTRTNRDDYIIDNRYVMDKVNRYRVELTDALNTLHGTQYSKTFWFKALGMGFVRFVHMLYDGYKVCSLFNPNIHTVKVMDRSSYHHFQDFEESRRYFQNKDFGYEQMFSVYVSLFHPDVYENCRIAVDEAEQPQPVKKSTAHAIQRLKKITPGKVYDKAMMAVFSKQQPEVGILHSFFSSENFRKLYTKSRGRIRQVEFDHYCQTDCKIDHVSRKVLSGSITIVDEFDKFFVQAFYHCFPTLYIEAFQQQLNFFLEQSKKYPDLKYLISEAWIGNSRLSFLIAVLQQKGVLHIYNEHNYLEHFFEGNHVDQLVSMCDLYYSIGWENGEYRNLRKGASLFPFALKRRKKKKMIDLLYVGSLPAAKMAEINCAYGEQEENAPRYLQCLQGFFSALSDNVLSKTVYRYYPNHNAAWLQYDHWKVMTPFLPKLKGVDDFSRNSKVQMLRSRLVVVDYLSTAYLELLIMNIPTVIIFDTSRYFLKPEYNSIFNDLIEAGICQLGPLKAAEFVNNIVETPEQWWESPEVQRARQNFLNDNIGNPQTALQFYMSLLRQ